MPLSRSGCVHSMRTLQVLGQPVGELLRRVFSLAIRHPAWVLGFCWLAVSAQAGGAGAAVSERVHLA